MLFTHMRVTFTKMHGLGNDFIVLDASGHDPLPSAATWRRLADRHTGIGFDQALVLEAPRQPGTTVFYRIFNADGGEVEQCGNGARCVAELLRRRGLVPGDALRMDSPAGIVEARILAPGCISVNMGKPDFEPCSLPFDAPAAAMTHPIEVDGEQLEISVVSMGNPHAVLRVPAVASAPVERIGAAMQAHPRFPRQVNVGFMQVLDASHIALRVYERGVGETQACGTGACAAVAVGRNLGLLGADVAVQLPGGRLDIHWDGPGHALWMTGPAEVAFEGHADI
jgi:diaminopimelate epimerase